MGVRISFYEHHWRKIVDIPRAGDFNKPCLLPLHQWLHPFLGLLRVIDFGPRIPCAEPIRLTVMVRHGVIILNAVAEHELGPLLARLPPGGNRATRRLAAEVCQHLPGLIQNVSLLLKGHIDWVLMAIAMEANLMTGIANHGALLWERLQ